MATKTARPNSLNYDNYFSFLQDYFAYKKNSDRSFSLRNFAKQLKVSAPHVKYLLDGERKLSITLAKKMCRVFNLPAQESIHFLILVKLEKKFDIEYRKSLDEMTTFFIRLIVSLTVLPDFKTDPQWISQRLNNLLSLEEAKKTLKYILDEKIICLVDGKYQQDPQHDFSIYHQKRSNQSIKNRQQIMQRLYTNSFKYGTSSLTLQLTREEAMFFFQETIAHLVDFQKETQQTSNQNNKKIYTFSFNVFQNTK